MMNGQMQQPQTVQVDMNQMVPVTLNLHTWNIVMNMIAEQPWKNAEPLMQELRRQIDQVVNPQPQSPANSATTQ